MREFLAQVHRDCRWPTQFGQDSDHGVSVMTRDIKQDVVDKLVKLKHAGTEIVISAPFGKTAVHPMHLDATPHPIQQVERLKTELPKD